MNVLQIKRGKLVDIPTGVDRLKPGEFYFAEDVNMIIVGKNDQSTAQFVDGNAGSPVVVEQADTSSGNHSAVLPDVVVMESFTYIVKADGLIGGQVDITTQAGQYIDFTGNDAISLFQPYGSMRFYSTGSIWLII